MENEIIHSIVYSDLIFSSSLWLKWRRWLYQVPNNPLYCVVLHLYSVFDYGMLSGASLK